MDPFETRFSFTPADDEAMVAANDELDVISVTERQAADAE